LKKARVQKIFSSLQVNCSRARHKYSVQELRKAYLELHLPEKSRGEGSFGLAHCLDKAAGAGEGGLTGGEDAGIVGRATVGAGAVSSMEQNRSRVGWSGVELLRNGWVLTIKWGTTLVSACALCLDLLSCVWLHISGGPNCCQKFRRRVV